MRVGVAVRAVVPVAVPVVVVVTVAVVAARLARQRVRGDDQLAEQADAGHRGCDLDRRADELRGVEDPGGAQVDELVALDVEPLSRGGGAHARHRERRVEARVGGQLAQRGLERARDDLRA